MNIGIRVLRLMGMFKFHGICAIPIPLFHVRCESVNMKALLVILCVDWVSL